jgi:hypothetical protein
MDPLPVQAPLTDGKNFMSLPWTRWLQKFITLPEPAIAYTPVITAGAGAFTTVSATGRYRKIGKLIFIQITITITTNGTAASFVIASLPFATVNVAGVNHMLAGGILNSGAALIGFAIGNTSQLRAFKYDSSYPGADGETLVLSGFYEVA